MRICKTTRTLYQHTYRTIFSVLLIYLLLTVVAAISFLMYPLLNNSAEDLSKLIVNSVERWPALNAADKKLLADKLYAENKIVISEDITTGTGSVYLPYIWLLEHKLNEALENPVNFIALDKDITWYAAQISIRDTSLSIRFSQEKIGTRPPFFLISALFFSIALSLITSFYLARHITASIQNLVNAARQLSRGQLPDKIPETGYEELRLLASSFNTMSADVKKLLDNRITLLVGISHNLRTPLARLHLAMALLPDTIDIQLRQKINTTLNEMNDTITQFMDFAQGMNQENDCACDVGELIKDLVSNLQIDNRLQYHIHNECTLNIPHAALRQILINITENALAYSDDKPVMIECLRDNDDILITVIDQGPGVPATMIETIFQPFVRLAGNQTKGAGLGLAIADLACKTQGWTLQLLPGASGGTLAQLRIPYPRVETI